MDGTLSAQQRGDLVAVAGASGFIGRALMAALQPRFRVAGISRAGLTAEAARAKGQAEWRRADLFNLREATRALEGVRYAVYLVHSMMPSAKLTQGTFSDLDLICADNFARAAEAAGVEQIVYLGGLVPPGTRLSPHLASRLEVERTLASRGVPVTALRAGLVIGGGGSSFDILLRLVRRLPAMVCPRWTLTRMQPVAVADVVQLLSFAVGRRETYGQTFDVGAPEAVSYRELMALCADLLGLRRQMVPIRLMTPWLSKLWVQLVTGAPGELVGPLVESLRHEMVARDLRLARMAGLEPTPVRVALERALLPGPARAPSPRPAGQPKESRPQIARSVQRMQLPAGADAAFAAAEYQRWLPRLFRGLIRTRTQGPDTICFALPLVDTPMLVLTRAPSSTSDRQLFFISGGSLARAGQAGRFELRQVLDGHTLLTAVHDFGPSLPWYLYKWTQAAVHAWVMAAFGRHLQRVSPGGGPARLEARADGLAARR